MSKFNHLPAEGFVRIWQIIGTKDQPGPIPVSRALWFQLVKIGAVPQPVRIGLRVTAYHVNEIRELIQFMADGYTFDDLAGYWPRKGGDTPIADGGTDLATHL